MSGAESYDAFLLVSFGGPEGMADVPPFLDHVLRGRNVPPERRREAAHHYERFGGVSPIVRLPSLIAGLNASGVIAALNSSTVCASASGSTPIAAARSRIVVAS